MENLWRKLRGGRTPADVWADWMAANDAGDVDRAGTFAAEMTRVAADSFAAWFEAGLHAKARRDWPRCLEWNQRAVELFGQTDAREYDGVNPAAWMLSAPAPNSCQTTRQPSRRMDPVARVRVSGALHPRI